MSTFVMILLGGAMLATLGVLAAGLVTMVRKREGGGETSNRLMQARIGFQALALVLFGLAILMKG